MQKIIAANWKMYKTRPQAAQTAAEIALALKDGTPLDRLAVIFAPFTDIAVVADAIAGIKNLEAGGQNFYPEEQGAFTGEISPAMLRDAGAQWLLTGHSERRHIFGETDALVARKTAFGLEKGFKVMLCVGETLDEREAGKLSEVLERQLASAIKPLDAKLRSGLAGAFAIAYEPVWAIGTGKVAGPAEVLDAHAVTHGILTDILGVAAQNLPILYGGSVKPENAASLINLDNVDGLLIGGASLEAKSFLQILGA